MFLQDRGALRSALDGGGIWGWMIEEFSIFPNHLRHRNGRKVTLRGRDPLVSTFTDNANMPLFEIDVIHLQDQQLRNANAACVQDMSDGQKSNEPMNLSQRLIEDHADFFDREGESYRSRLDAHITKTFQRLHVGMIGNIHSCTEFVKLAKGPEIFPKGPVEELSATTKLYHKAVVVILVAVQKRFSKAGEKVVKLLQAPLPVAQRTLGRAEGFMIRKETVNDMLIFLEDTG